MPESWRQLTTDQQAEFEEIMPESGWRVIPGSELPSVFPYDFQSKLDSALVIVEPTDTGGTYLVTNAVRLDFKDKALDQEPFGLIVSDTGAGSIGVFIHHGTWSGRTEHPPEEFWEEATSSGIGNYFLAVPPSGSMLGSLDELPKGHRGAFDAVVESLRRQIDYGVNPSL